MQSVTILLTILINYARSAPSISDDSQQADKPQREKLPYSVVQAFDVRKYFEIFWILKIIFAGL